MKKLQVMLHFIALDFESQSRDTHIPSKQILSEGHQNSSHL
jgi:hypothetical protein